MGGDYPAYFPFGVWPEWEDEIARWGGDDADQCRAIAARAQSKGLSPVDISAVRRDDAGGLAFFFGAAGEGDYIVITATAVGSYRSFFR